MRTMTWQHGKPAVLEYDNDGSWLYRLNIEPEMGFQRVKKKKPKSGGSAMKCAATNKATKENVKRVVIRSVIDETAEFDLVNSYNKHVLGVAVNESAVEEYKEYLQFTEDLDAVLVEDLSN